MLTAQVARNNHGFCLNKMGGNKHNQLQKTAINWLYCKGCSIFAEEVPTWNGVADAIGIITNQRYYGKPDTVYYIEAKSSRSDLLSRKQKACYQRTENVYLYHENDIDFFYFIISDDVTIEPELYPLWGVINEQGQVIRRAKRLKKEKNSSINLVTNLAHVLVYKVFGKLYSPSDSL